MFRQSPHSTAEMGHFNGAYFTSATESFITHQWGITLQRDPYSRFHSLLPSSLSLSLSNSPSFSSCRHKLKLEFRKRFICHDNKHIEPMPHSISSWVRKLSLSCIHLPVCIHALLLYARFLKLLLEKKAQRVRWERGKQKERRALRSTSCSVSRSETAVTPLSTLIKAHLAYG